MLISAAALVAQDQPVVPPFPREDSYENYCAYVEDFGKTSPVSGTTFWEPFRPLAAEKRYGAILFLTQALHDRAPEKDYCLAGDTFINPVTVAYQEKQYDLVRALVKFDPKLADMNNFNIRYNGLCPLAETVKNDDQVLTEFLLDAGAQINTEYVESKGEGSGYPTNLLSICPSQAMKKFLLARGIATVCPFQEPLTGKIKDDGVRLRSLPSTQGQVLTKLAQGDELTILGITYENETVGDASGRWVEVRHGDFHGWVFSPFVACNAFDLP